MTALARTWRPKQFNSYVGQDHVTTSLINTLENKRIHHAYLFSGTRGVGKTTIARIFAKALSCKQGISSNPCNECSNCKDINQGNFIDLIEVDAASKTKVEDTRELLDHTQFVPHSSRFKIFIIDEVHMLSNHSFNALLKTLEEPPEHVKFLLATTDPEKLPVTVLSRCLHFKLLPISVSSIQQQLVKILTAENVAFQEQALTLIAENANGSLRDALSSADQMIALSNAEINYEAACKFLGIVNNNIIEAIFLSLIAHNKQDCFDLVTRLHKEGSDLKKVLGKIIESIHDVMMDLSQSKTTTWLDESSAWQAMSVKQKKETLQYWYQIAIFSIRDFDYTPTPIIAINICIIRMLEFTNKQPSAENASILSNLALKGMAKAISEHLTVTKHTPEELVLSIANDKKSLLSPPHAQKIKNAIKDSGYNGVITITSNQSNNKSKLAQAFNGTIVSER